MLADVIDAGLALAMALGAVGGWLIRRIIARSDSHDRRLGNLEINSARHHERLLALERKCGIYPTMPRRANGNGRGDGL